MKTILKNTLVLLIITFIAGAMLAGTYFITKAPIADAERKAEEAAFSASCPGADHFEKTDVVFDTKNEDLKFEAVQNVYDAENKLIGRAVKVKTKAGYGGDILMVVGVNLQNEITGFNIIAAASESPGLGANCLTSGFQSQFVGKRPGVTFSKTGAGDNEIDAISGATITTSAVTTAVAEALAQFVALGGQ